MLCQQKLAESAKCLVMTQQKDAESAIFFSVQHVTITAKSNLAKPFSV